MKSGCENWFFIKIIEEKKKENNQYNDTIDNKIKLNKKEKYLSHVKDKQNLRTSIMEKKKWWVIFLI